MLMEDVQANIIVVQLYLMEFQVSSYLIQFFQFHIKHQNTNIKNCEADKGTTALHTTRIYVVQGKHYII